MVLDLHVLIPLCLIAALAGVIRGFTGFGSALVFIPPASAIIEPWQAVITLFIIDGLTSLPLLPRAMRECTWREVVPLSLGATFALPLGAYFLVAIDPTALRWALSGLALGAVAFLASGWRYRHMPSHALSAGVGIASGFLGGMASFYGPPIVVFWLGGQSASMTVRANVIVFLQAMTFAGAATYLGYGLFKPAVVQQALLLLPAYGGALWLGAKLFPFASDRLFRRIAYLVITGAAVSSAPAFGHHSD